MRDICIDNGGQGGSNAVMDNQRHKRGEPLKPDDGSLRPPDPVGEPRTFHVGGQEVLLSEKVVASLISSYHEDADNNGEGGFCYFAAADSGLIKIGFTNNPKTRLKALRTTAGRDIKYLGIALGGRLRERAYHFQFGQYRVRGEWFERHSDILAEVERLSIPHTPRGVSLT